MVETNQEKGQLTAEMLNLISRIVLRGGSAMQAFRKEVLNDIGERVDIVSKTVGAEGIDPFGMDPKSVHQAAVVCAFLYRIYFRCLSRGLENVPEGPVILVANHAGQLPIDGVMISVGMMLDRTSPRLVRAMVDNWVPSLPFVSTFFSRVGMAVGVSENAVRLLDRGEVLLTFPEGMHGISKTVDEAYKLQDFSLGFMRLALSSKTPIVPVAVVGSEEQYPTLYNLKGVGKLLGLPAVPIWAQIIIPFVGLLPLPVRYRLHFGEPMTFEGDPDDEDAAIGLKVNQVRDRLRDMLDALRAERKSVFL